jgi:hypothetical protein
LSRQQKAAFYGRTFGNLFAAAEEHIMDSRVVKYVVGLRLGKRCIHSFEEAAHCLGIKKPYLSQIVACTRRPARYQAALAKLCGCYPHELFGQFTHPSLVSSGAETKPRKEIA